MEGRCEPFGPVSSLYDVSNPCLVDDIISERDKVKVAVVLGWVLSATEDMLRLQPAEAVSTYPQVRQTILAYVMPGRTYGPTGAPEAM